MLGKLYLLVPVRGSYRVVGCRLSAKSPGQKFMAGEWLERFWKSMEEEEEEEEEIDKNLAKQKEVTRES